MSDGTGALDEVAEKKSRHRRASALLAEGKAREAGLLLRAILEEHPGAAAARHDLAVALAGQGLPAEAIAELRRVVAEQPAFAEAWGNLAVLLGQAGERDEAREAWERSAALRPEHVEGRLHASAACRACGKLDDAAAHLEAALALLPGLAEGWLRLGVVRALQGRPGDAAACYRSALERRPDYPEALNNLGALLRERGELDEAARLLERALELRPGAAKTLVNLGAVRAAQGDEARAAARFEEALRLQPSSHEAHNNLGSLRLAQGRLDEAVACFQKAIQAKPDYAEAYSNLGLAFGRQGALHQAVAFFDQALHWKPGQPAVHLNKAIHCLALGDFERGWAEYEWRGRTAKTSPRTFAAPAWDGSPLAGRTVLLHAEQGLGDTLQFIRYAALVKARGGAVVVECQAALTTLLSRAPGIDRLVAAGTPPPPYAAHASLMSLPRLLRTTLATVPQEAPYVRADLELVASWKRELDAIPGVKVGVAWQGSKLYADDAQRSIPLRRFAPLAAVDGVALVSLQKGFGEEQIAEAGLPLASLSRRLDEAAGSFMDTAAVMLGLDLVVTSDSAIAHLAGALVHRPG